MNESRVLCEAEKSACEHTYHMVLCQRLSLQCFKGPFSYDARTLYPVKTNVISVYLIQLRSVVIVVNEDLVCLFVFVSAACFHGCSIDLMSVRVICSI